MRVDNQRTSEILQHIADRCNGDTMSMRDFTTMMGNRAFALVILVFSLPNSLPIPGIPGFSTLTGLPILFIGLQMVLGQERIWLPRKIANKTFSTATLKKVLLKAIPWVVKLEKVLKPRWLAVCSPTGERILGLFIVSLSGLLVLPIPGGNFLPGLSISILAISFLEKDGLVASLGMIFAAASYVFMFELIGDVVRWLHNLINT